MHHLTLTGGVLAAVLATAAATQEPGAGQEQLRAQRAQKLEAPFLRHADWITDLGEALAAARETGKPVFAYFTRSYAPCPPCSALEAGALAEEQFRAFAQDVVLFCHVTSHVDGEPHPDLMRQKGGTSFPHLAFLDADGNLIARQDGRSADSFHDTLDGAVRAFAELRAAADRGEREARVQLLARRVELGHFGDFEAARAELAATDGLGDELRARLEQALVDQEFNLILGSVRGPAEAADAGARTRPMFDKGRIPASGSLPVYYWAFLGRYAEREGDLALLERAVGELAKIPRARPMLAELQPALDALRKGR